MGAVAVKEEIYETVVGNAAHDAVELFHGYTYSGHPAACAAGIATMDVSKRKTFLRARAISPKFLDTMFSLRDLPVVTDIRGYGMLCGIDLSLKERPGMRGHEGAKSVVRSWAAPESDRRYAFGCAAVCDRRRAA